MDNALNSFDFKMNTHSSWLKLKFSACFHWTISKHAGITHGCSRVDFNHILSCNSSYCTHLQHCGPLKLCWCYENCCTNIAHSKRTSLYYCFSYIIIWRNTNENFVILIFDLFFLLKCYLLMMNLLATDFLISWKVYFWSI